MAIAGVTGSLLVIAVNGWMNDPGGYDVVDGKVTNVRPFEALFGGNVWHELVHMYLAGYLVVGLPGRRLYGRRWMAGRRDHYTRTALVIGSPSRRSPRPSRSSWATGPRARWPRSSRSSWRPSRA